MTNEEIFLETFYMKIRIKDGLFWHFFFFFQKVVLNFFLKWYINKWPKDTVNKTLFLKALKINKAKYLMPHKVLVK